MVTQLPTILSDFQQLRQCLKDELTQNILPFWSHYSVDHECGGFLTCLDRRGDVFDTVKQAWMQWREIYMFAALYNSLLSKPEFLELALHGVKFMLKHGRNNKGVYHYLLDRQGNVISDKADGFEIFGGSFAAIAFAELYRATHDEKFAAEARQALAAYRQAIVSAGNSSPWCHLAHPMIELNVLQNIRRNLDDDSLNLDVDRCIADIFACLHPTYGILFENRKQNGTFDLNCPTGRFTNPGHGLEGLSFILEEIRIRQENSTPLNSTLVNQTLNSVKNALEYGWDNQQGGIWYYKDILDKPMVIRHEFMLKSWWSQNEAATAALRAFELSHAPLFLEWFHKIEQFAWTHLRDHEYPEWFPYAAVDGRQLHSYKGSCLKGFFHIPRHLLDCITICNRLIK